MLNVGVIGLGVMGKSHAQIYDRIPGINLKGICGHHRDVMDELHDRYGSDTYDDFRDLLADESIDAVSICLPDNLHLDATLEAVKRHKHILLEKPIADNLKDAQTIYDAVKDYDRVFTLGYNLRQDTRYTRARESIEKQEIGQIIHIASRRNSGIGGPLRFIGHTDLSMHVMCHDINIINWMVPSKPVSVFEKKRDCILKEYGMTDTILAIITYEDGTIVSMEACWVMNPKWPSAVDDQLEIVGTEGVIYIEGCDKGYCLVNDDGVKRPDTRYRAVVNGHFAGDLGEELLGFLECIEKGKKPIVSAEEGLMDLKVVDAIERSTSSGAEVMIEGA